MGTLLKFISTVSKSTTVHKRSSPVPVPQLDLTFLLIVTCILTSIIPSLHSKPAPEPGPASNTRLIPYSKSDPDRVIDPKGSECTHHKQEQQPVPEIVLESILKVTPATDNKQFSITLLVNTLMGLGKRPAVTVTQKPCRCGVRNENGKVYIEEIWNDDDTLHFEAGSKSGRIYNGHPARINEFPWRVSINPVGNPSVSICAGALISKEWVLTSASCIHETSVEHMLIDLGDHNLATATETVNVLVRPTEKIVHDDYNRPGPENKSASRKCIGEEDEESLRSCNFNTFEDHDIALLKLGQPVSGDNIMPVCLPRHLDPKHISSTSGGSVVTSGWGGGGSGGLGDNLQKPNSTATVPKRNKTSTLRKAVLTYYTNEEYKSVIGPISFPTLRTPESDNLVFTFDTNKGIYPLDYGTTIEHYDLERGLYYAVGVADAVQVTEGRDGGQNILGAWADVTKYLDWIDSKTEGTKFCTP